MLTHIIFFPSLTTSNCLENKPKNLGDSISQPLPGQVLTLEEQCLARGGRPCIVRFQSNIPKIYGYVQEK